MEPYFGQLPNMTANNVRMKQDIVSQSALTTGTPLGGSVILCTFIYQQKVVARSFNFQLSTFIKNTCNKRT